MSKPRTSVSAVLLSYNCSDFIGDAVRSVLNQDCESIEVVISDDASNDGTAQIIEKEISQYPGPHTIVIRQRASNSGSKSAHLNDVLKHVSGNIVVLFDGDDVSKSSRVDKIVHAFRRNSATQAVYSSYALIDEEGRPLGSATAGHPPPGTSAMQWFAHVGAFASGGTLAFRRAVFDKFGPLNPDIHEDVVLPFRASLLGDVVYLDEKLVKVRRHGKGFTQNPEMYESLDNYRGRFLLGIDQTRRQCASRFMDVQTAKRLEPDRVDEFDELHEVIKTSMVDAEFSAGLVSQSLRTRIRTLVGLAAKRSYRDSFARDTFLTFAPNLYLRYKRRKHGIRRSAHQS